jgi:predicted phage terminase large subunit-like protein
MKKTEILIKKLYKDDRGKPLELTPSQLELFDLIFFKKYPYNLILAFTRYGKSFVTALAVLTRCLFFPEKWAIVAPTEKHAKIIMGYIIDHIFDNEFAISKLEIQEGESLERLRRERSKSRLTFKVYKRNDFSEIYILSAHSEKENPLRKLMGFGAQNVVLDESALISDEQYAGVLRMLGDSPNPFLLEISNPLKKNHLWEAFNDPKFNKIVIDYKKGLEEGRITPEQVELMKKQPFFDVLYECKFPSESEIFKKEWLIKDNDDLKELEIISIGTDLAVSERETADFNTIVVCGLKKDGKISIRLSKQFRGGLNVFLNLTNHIYELYNKGGKTILLGIEDVGYQRVVGEEIERRFGLAPIYVKRAKDKRSRFLALSVYFQNKQIVFHGEHDELLDQLLSYPTGEHDDLIDALEMSVSLLKDYMIKVEEIEEEEKPKTFKEKILSRIKQEQEGEEIYI